MSARRSNSRFGAGSHEFAALCSPAGKSQKRDVLRVRWSLYTQLEGEIVQEITYYGLTNTLAPGKNTGTYWNRAFEALRGRADVRGLCAQACATATSAGGLRVPVEEYADWTRVLDGETLPCCPEDARICNRRTAYGGRGNIVRPMSAADMSCVRTRAASVSRASAAACFDQRRMDVLHAAGNRHARGDSVGADSGQSCDHEPASLFAGPGWGAWFDRSTQCFYDKRHEEA